jgi:hypothetical protein
VNRISVIELRTDPKYGKFMKHEPATAKVNVARKNDMIVCGGGRLHLPNHHRAFAATSGFAPTED